MEKTIIEKRLGITGDYQYQAVRSRNYLQANWHSNKLGVLKELLDRYHPKTVLDLGTGSGNFELTFANHVQKIVGVDYNDDALAFLEKELKKQKIKNVQLIKRDITTLSGANGIGKFDMIIMIDVLEHIKIESGEKLIKSFRKFLTPHGKVVIVTPNYGGLWPVIEKGIDRFTKIPNLEDMQHVAKFDFGSLPLLFEKHGFNTIYGRTFNTFSYLMPGKKLASALCTLEQSIAFPYGNLLLFVFESEA
jgi:2-polyprenyl-3-methyl-5-hydroxy-6-metoxy-1,4-benzoquinol methylase